MLLNLFKKELTQKETKREIFFSVIISYITVFASILINLFFTPFLLRNIGSSQYGIHSFAASIVSWLSIITTALCSGYLKFATQITKEDKGNISFLNGLYFWFFAGIDVLVILVGLGAAGLFWSGLIPLAKYTPTEKILVPPCVLLMAINSFISIFVSYFSLFESFKERFVWARLITLIQKVLNPAICIPLILLGGNVVVICAVQVALTFINLLLLGFHAIVISKMRVKLRLKWGANKKFIISVVSFSLFALLSTVANSINQSADQILLGLLSQPTNVAIYQLGLSFVSYLALFCSSITNSLSTKLFREDSQNPAIANSSFLKISTYQMMLAFLIVGGFASCGKDFMILWAGKEHYQAFYIGLMLFVVNLFSFTNTSSEVLVKSRGFFKFEAIYYLVEAISNFLLSLLLMLILEPAYSIFACCIATVIVMICFRWIGLTIFFSKRVGLPMGQYFSKLVKFFLITMACLGLTLGVTRVFLSSIRDTLTIMLIEGFLFTFLYSVIIFLFERATLKNLFKSMFSKKR